MPSEIENYVHRIGRTGRCGKTGVATTFINKNVDESVLLDLKHLLMEAKQRVPPVIAMITPPEGYEGGILGGESAADGSDKGCAYCGGLGHRIANCPKLEKQKAQQAGAKKELLIGGW